MTDNFHFSDKNSKLWRITAVFFSICWILQFFYVYNCSIPKKLPFVLIPPIKYTFIILSFTLSLFLIIKPFYFYIYTFELGSWGLLAIADGYNIDGLLILLLSWAFALKAGSFRKNKAFQIGSFSFFILSAFFSQLRFGLEYFKHSFVTFSAYLVIVAFLFRFLLIGYRTVSSEKKNHITISGDEFTEQEKLYINKIIIGTPYKEIALTYHINISTVKRTSRKLCKILHVSNKSELLCHFGEYKIDFE